MPKSASTSIVNTIQTAYSLERYPEGLWPNRVSGEFVALARLWPAHMKELTTEDVRRMGSRDVIARMHIIPSKNNLELLSEERLVVLLRDHLDVLRSLRRSVQNGLSELPQDFHYCGRSEDAWLDRATALGITDDLVDFAKAWRGFSGDALVLDYAAISPVDKTVAEQISDYWRLPKKDLTVRNDNRPGGLSAALMRMTRRVRRLKRCLKYG